MSDFGSDLLESARRADTRREVLSDVDPVVLEAWRLQGRKVGAMTAEAQSAVIELQEERDDLREQVETLAGLLKRCARCLPADHKTRKLATEYLRQHGHLSPLRTSGADLPDGAKR